MKANIPKNYFQAEVFLSDKNSRRIPGIRSTSIQRLDDERIALIYHETNVVPWYKNGDVCLNSGGHRTKTTKKRMNQGSPFAVYQNNHRWFVSDNNSSISFMDGIVLRTQSNHHE
jgi:hypothetical protein